MIDPIPLRRSALFAACVISAAGALVFNAFPLFLSTIADQFQLNDEQLGLLGTAYLGGFAPVALIAPLWISRFKPKALACFSYSLVAISMLSLSLIESSERLYWVMAGLGLGAGVMFTLGLEVLAHSWDPDRAFGFKLVAEMMLAGLVMFVMTGMVIDQFGYPGFTIGVLVVYGITAMAVIALPGDNITIELGESAESDTDNHAAWLAALALFIQFGVFSALWGFMMRIGLEIGVSEAIVGTAMSLSIVAGLAGAILGAAMGNRFGHVRPLLVVFSLTMASIFCLHASGGVVLFFLAACTINALLQVSVIYQMGLITATDNTGKVTALMAFLLAAGGAVGPGIAGLVLENNGFGSMYVLLAGITVISILLTVLSGRIFLSTRTESFSYCGL